MIGLSQTFPGVLVLGAVGVIRQARTPPVARQARECRAEVVHGLAEHLELSVYPRGREQRQPARNLCFDPPVVAELPFVWSRSKLAISSRRPPRSHRM